MASQTIDIESTVPRTEGDWVLQCRGFYACPVCKRDLEPATDGLFCPACVRIYPIVSGIPDLTAVNFAESNSFDMRMLARRDSGALLNFAASVYETGIYPIVSRVYGGWGGTSTLQRMAHEVADILGSSHGVILDAACGPGTYGRRVASASRTVLGIDICMSMLRQGVRYVKKEHIPNVHFARAAVEALPFRSGLFDAAINAGSLNHFPDTVLALREIHRTMKDGAPLAVMCFYAGDKGLMKSKSLRERAGKRGGHIFELAELERCVAEAGFEEFRAHFYGSIVVFSARKGQAES